MAKVGVGDLAPDFTLQDQHGRPVTLSSLRGDKLVVLFFYPKDETRVCTAEACSFRDSFQVFQDAGAVVIGVSPDSTESHAGFAANHRLPFTLLADVGGRVAKSYGARLLGLLTSRVTFVIDRQGVIRHRFTAQMVAREHVDEALRVVRSIRR